MTTSNFSKVTQNFSQNKTTQIIAFVSTKGGVGKTTCTANVSALLADMGFSVLMIDGDVQPSLSKFYPLHKTAPSGIVEFLLGENTDDNVSSCISKTIYPNLDIVLSNNISGDIQLKIQQRLDRSVLLKQKLLLPAITKNYDFIIIDTQGAVGALQEAACFAADLLISPVRPEMLSAREFLTGTVDEMMKRLSQGSAIGLQTPPLAAVIYAQDRTRDARDIADEIRACFNQFIDGKKRLLKTVVPSTKAYKEAQTERVPVHCFDNKQKNKSIDCAYDIMHSLVYEICPPIAERQLEAACFVNGLLAEETDNGLPENITQQNQDDSVKNTTQNGSGCLNNEENDNPSDLPLERKPETECSDDELLILYRKYKELALMALDFDSSVSTRLTVSIAMLAGVERVARVYYQRHNQPIDDIVRLRHLVIRVLDKSESEINALADKFPETYADLQKKNHRLQEMVNTPEFGYGLSGCLNNSSSPDVSQYNSGSLLSSLAKNLDSTANFKKGFAIQVSNLINNGYGELLYKYLDLKKPVDFSKLHYPACFFTNKTPLEYIQVAISTITSFCLDNPTTEKVQALLDEMIGLSIDSPFEYFIELCETANAKGEE